ncbi:deoxynucleoside kinase [Candidatus Aminicenantes bacterium AC-334-K16]|jgi:deoxyadenosine/deoxycytidine kinase|nr:deoxynucleoside kinase [Candidatus Aminicenantes bacterium AC-334-K16]
MSSDQKMKTNLPFRHIAIEGMMKSGKTKLARKLAEKLGARVVYDRVDNPYLADFYNEKEGAAFLAQLVFLVNRYHQQSALVQRTLFEETIICDYLFEKDKIYAYQTLTDDELLVYEKIFNIFSERIAKPDLVVYLQISLPTLLERIKRWGSELEKNISEGYLKDVLEAFDYFFFNYQAVPLFVVKADHLEFEDEETIQDLIQKISQIKKSPLYYVPLSEAKDD